MSETKNTKTILSEGLLLAAIPIAAHSLAFLYQLGFCSYFHIPSTFIVIDINTILLVIGSLLFVAGALFLISNLLFIVVPNEKMKGVIFWRFFKLAIPAFTVFANIILFGSLWSEWIPSFIVLVFLVFLEFVFPLLTQRSQSTYTEKLKAADDVDARVRKIPDILATSDSTRPILALFLVFTLLASVSYSSGRAEAMKKETFLIADENSPLLILRIYGDNLIGVPFRSKEKRLSSEFLVVKISDMKTSLQLRKVGRLIPQGDLSY